jgi:hypothetical protein
MKTFRKTATVQAKLFEQGDEDGMITDPSKFDAIDGLEQPVVPYISTLENQYHRGEFGKHYVCVGIDGERWLVDRDIFERTYEEVK